MSNFSTNLVRFVLKLANVLLLLLGISMGLYALSTFEEYKKLKHGGDGNATLVEFPHLDIPLGHSHLDFNLNSTKVPVFITGLGEFPRSLPRSPPALPLPHSPRTH